MTQRRRKNAEQGFTLLEIIVVLAVLGALAAILSPVVFRYIDDANRSRAEADANTIAASIQQVYKDTGRWAYHANAAGQVPYQAGTDAAVLTSNTAATCASDGNVADDDNQAPVDGSGDASWSLSSALCHTLASHVVSNGRSYPTSGPRQWRGPYLDTIPAGDPWGRSYLVNIANANPSGTNWVIVLSAGPNGTIETDSTQAVTGTLVVGGDDIIARVK